MFLKTDEKTINSIENIPNVNNWPNIKENTIEEIKFAIQVNGKTRDIIKVKKGSSIKKGDTLVILEAMKMEHKVLAPDNGKIKEVLIKENEQVENGATLVVLD